MSILSGFFKTIKYRMTNEGYKWQSEKTSSQTVVMGNGTDNTDTAEKRFGAINGITSSLNTNNDNYALSAAGGYNLQSQVTKLDTPENPEPTEPIIETLENIKTNKISELNTICNKMITSGVDVEIDGKTEHFSYTIEDQANIDDIAQMAKSTNMEQSYHCDNGSCKLYTVEEITKIYMTQKMNKAHNITYANQLKLYVKSLKEKAEVESIAYGQDLTGEYLNTYNTIMEHEQSVAKAFIATE